MSFDVTAAGSQQQKLVDEVGGNINNMGFKLNGPDDQPEKPGLGALLGRFTKGTKDMLMAFGAFASGQIRPIAIGGANIAPPQMLAPRDHGKPVEGKGSTSTAASDTEDDDPKRELDDLLGRSGVTPAELATAGIDMDKVSRADARRILKTAKGPAEILRMLKDASSPAAAKAPAAAAAPASRPGHTAPASSAVKTASAVPALAPTPTPTPPAVSPTPPALPGDAAAAAATVKAVFDSSEAFAELIKRPAITWPSD